MKHLMIMNTLIAKIGDTYTTDVDDLDASRYVHVIDGARFDQNFEHVEVNSVPEGIVDGDKYVNGEFVKVEQPPAEVVEE